MTTQDFFDNSVDQISGSPIKLLQKSSRELLKDFIELSSEEINQNKK